MALYYLIRHARYEFLGRGPASDVPGPGLDPEGERQARSLADRLGSKRFDAIYSSPFRRARETAEPLARRVGLEIRTADGMAEIGFGAWSGRRFDDLGDDPGWRRWNQFRSFARAPQGESMVQVQARSLSELERMEADRPEGTFAVFSHGDVIKAVVLWFLGMPVDFLFRLEISPASVTLLSLDGAGARLLRLNEV